MALSPLTIVIMVVVLVLLLYMVAISLVAFFRFRVDKKRAEDGQWRVTEKELFVYGAIGGAIGGWSAMWVYRHKTSKRRFCLPYLFMFLFDLVVLILLVALVIIIPAIYK